MLLKLARNCFVVLVVLFCALMVCAQEDALPRNFDPRMLDEFRKLNSEQLEARLDAAALTVNGFPSDLLYILVKRDRNMLPGFPVRYGTRIKTYFVKNRGIEEKRIKLFDGGESDFQEIELWLQPPEFGQYLQTTSDPETDTSQTFLFDGFWYPSPNDSGTCCEVDSYIAEEKRASLDAFAELLNRNEASKAYLVYYPTRLRDNGKRDNRQFAQRVLQKEKEYLIKIHQISTERVKTIRGIYKNYSDFQIWFVPLGGSNPPMKKALVIPKLNIKSRKTHIK